MEGRCDDVGVNKLLLRSRGEETMEASKTRKWGYRCIDRFTNGLSKPIAAAGCCEPAIGGAHPRHFRALHAHTRTTHTRHTQYKQQKQRDPTEPTQETQTQLRKYDTQNTHRFLPPPALSFKLHSASGLSGWKFRCRRSIVLPLQVQNDKTRQDKNHKTRPDGWGGGGVSRDCRTEAKANQGKASRVMTSKKKQQARDQETQKKRA